MGREILDDEIIRREAELCDRVEDFIISYSQHGGTGAGLSALIEDRLEDQYPKSFPIRIPVTPNCKPQSSEVVTCYNNVFNLSRVYNPREGINILVNNRQIADLLQDS